MAPGSRRREPRRLYTIGHSNRELDEFISLLTDSGIELVVDVRQFPRSRNNPQFNQETLPDALRERGIEYEHVLALGGRRRKSKDVPPETNGFWQHRSFHNYADYALSDEFGAALDGLRGRADELVPALMCSEAVWWRCHRRIITDHLLARGDEVFHIMAPGKTETARPTEGAVFEDGTVRYPAE